MKVPVNLNLAQVEIIQDGLISLAFELREDIKKWDKIRPETVQLSEEMLGNVEILQGEFEGIRNKFN